MWEAVATPAELLTKHKLTTYVVAHGPDQTVASIETVAAPAKPEGETAAPAKPEGETAAPVAALARSAVLG